MDTTQFLAKLDTTAAPEVEAILETAPVSEKPWYSESPRRMSVSGRGFGERFVQSLRWLASSRVKQG
jgi:hypothetical protein